MYLHNKINSLTLCIGSYISLKRHEQKILKTLLYVSVLQYDKFLYEYRRGNIQTVSIQSSLYNRLIHIVAETIYGFFFTRPTITNVYMYPMNQNRKGLGESSKQSHLTLPFSDVLYTKISSPTSWKDCDSKKANSNN
jgi:hypothetical protein